MWLLLMTKAGGVVVSVCRDSCSLIFLLIFYIHTQHIHMQPVPVYILVRALGPYIKKQPEEIE